MSRILLENVCHYLVLQLLPILLPTPVVPVTLVWWVPTRSLWPHWDTASSLWIRYLSLLLLNKLPHNCLIWGGKLTSSSGCTRATFYRQRTVLLAPPCTSCTLFYSVGGFCTWVDSGDVIFLPRPPLPHPSVSPSPPRWNLMAKSGDCWEMNFRKRCHSFHNNFTLLPHTVYLTLILRNSVTQTHTSCRLCLDGIGDHLFT